jgi:RES domain-containing protein
VVYASLTCAGATLETHAHANAAVPPPRAITAITLPRGTRVAEVTEKDVPRWDAADCAASRKTGDAWFARGRTVALITPSKAGAPLERNIVLDIAHRDARRLKVASLGPVPWDLRLFAPGVTEAKPPHRSQKRSE